MRPIDGDALEEIVRDGLKEVPHNDGLARRHHKAEHIHFLDLIRRAPTIAPPPNDPLTLEELRKMDGEPVWIRTKYDASKSFWAIVNTKGDQVESYARVELFEDYWSDWLAYRRKPEENT